MNWGFNPPTIPTLIIILHTCVCYVSVSDAVSMVADAGAAACSGGREAESDPSVTWRVAVTRQSAVRTCQWTAGSQLTTDDWQRVAQEKNHRPATGSVSLSSLGHFNFWLSLSLSDSLSETLSWTLKSGLRPKFNLNFGLNLTFAERLSERLCQKLKWPTAHSLGPCQTRNKVELLRCSTKLLGQFSIGKQSPNRHGF